MGVSIDRHEFETLDSFFRAIFGGETGYVGLGFRTPNMPEDKAWKREYFQWPEQQESLTKTVFAHRDREDVYYSPSLFISGSNGKKENVKGSRCFWCEFDGTGIPDWTKSDIPTPSIIVQSSTEDRLHCYWITDKFHDGPTAEKFNRGIAYKYHADLSGWDCNQLLRPPGTFNHKRQLPVRLLNIRTKAHDSIRFTHLPEPPQKVDAIKLSEKLPSIEDLVFRYPFTDQAKTLFKEGRPEGQRSTGLMALGHYMAEAGAKPEEILAILINADKRWGKFSKRSDCLTRLGEIVTIAVGKSRSKSNGKPADLNLVSLGLKSLLETEQEIEWVWDYLLQTNGYFCLTGPPSVGKTQLALNVGRQMAFGKPFLGRNLKQQRFGYFSLEMGLVDIKYFLSQQCQGMTPEELELLEEKFRIFPLGEPLYLDDAKVGKEVERIIKGEGFDGIFVDSMGSADSDDLGKPEVAKRLMDWNDRLRANTGAWTFYIHHHRKAYSGNKKPNKLSDVYGGKDITARATTVICLWGTGGQDVEVLPLKTRFASFKDTRPFMVRRDSRLHFHMKPAGITVISDEPKEAKVIQMHPESEQGRMSLEF